MSEKAKDSIATLSVPRPHSESITLVSQKQKALLTHGPQDASRHM